MKIINNKISLTEREFYHKINRLKKYRDLDYYITITSNNEEILAVVKAFNEKNILDRYNYIYNYMCKYLDNFVCNKCDFKDNKCIGNRDGKSVHKINGCCYFRNEGFCKFFQNKQCTNPNISCKLFMCSEVEHILKFKSLPKNYLLLSYFFNKKQLELLQYNYRVVKSQTISELMKIKNR